MDEDYIDYDDYAQYVHNEQVYPDTEKMKNKFVNFTASLEDLDRINEKKIERK